MSYERRATVRDFFNARHIRTISDPEGLVCFKNQPSCDDSAVHPSRKSISKRLSDTTDSQTTYKKLSETSLANKAKEKNALFSKSGKNVNQKSPTKSTVQKPSTSRRNGDPNITTKEAEEVIGHVRANSEYKQQSNPLVLTLDRENGDSPIDPETSNSSNESDGSNSEISKRGDDSISPDASGDTTRSAFTANSDNKNSVTQKVSVPSNSILNNNTRIGLSTLSSGITPAANQNSAIQNFQTFHDENQQNGKSYNINIETKADTDKKPEANSNICLKIFLIMMTIITFAAGIALLIFLPQLLPLILPIISESIGSALGTLLVTFLLCIGPFLLYENRDIFKNANDGVVITDNKNPDQTPQMLDLAPPAINVHKNPADNRNPSLGADKKSVSSPQSALKNRSRFQNQEVQPQPAKFFHARSLSEPPAITPNLRSQGNPNQNDEGHVYPLVANYPSPRKPGRDPAPL